jgi:CHAD domain-containing protein
MHTELVGLRGHEISSAPEPSPPAENGRFADRDFAVAHDYDTVDRDLERLGMTLSRLPAEAGVQWRLTLPRGERVEEWDPGNNGLALPAAVVRLIGGVVAGKELVPGPPASTDPGARRLREMLEAQREALLTHDPGVRLGADPENLHQHRVAARRSRGFLRAARAYLDPLGQRTLSDSLRRLGEVTGPVRDLDVVLKDLREELDRLDHPDREAVDVVVKRLERKRQAARRRLTETLEGDGYRVVLTRLRFPPRLAEGVDRVPLERLARKEFRKLVKAVERLGTDPDAERMHELRIKLKRARYAAELAVPNGAARRRFLADARRVQDVLGEHHDAVIAEEHLRAVAVDDVRTAAAFAAGRLAERLRGRRARAEECLPAAWKRLRKSGSGLT